MNFGTAGIQDAADLLEYCNAPAGTKYADLRVAHGYKEPHKIKYWCLGNEMDGPWQIGHMDAVSYARKANEAGKMMKMSDRSIKTILCGSSGPFMKTFPEWDRTALEIAWSNTDFLSLHNYATNWPNDAPGYLGYTVEFEKHIDTLATILRETKQKLSAKHDIFLSQDEWNVWYKDRNGDGKWQIAPALMEETYNLEDTLVFAMWLNVFLRKCDVLKMACLAQVVNVIAPLKTKRDALLKEATYYAFLMYTKNARGQSIGSKVEAPMMSTKRFGDVPQVDAAATTDPATGKSAVFLIHRNATETLKTELVLEGAQPPSKVTDAQQIWGLDPHAANTFDRPDVITPRQVGAMPFKDRRLPIKLPPLSVTMVVMEA
jgi:alpha-N-arabinofuranosidase